MKKVSKKNTIRSMSFSFWLIHVLGCIRGHLYLQSVELLTDFWQAFLGLEEPRAMFLSAFDLPKAVYIATSGAIALVIDSTRIATYFAGGTRLEPLIFFGLVAFIPASLLGSVAGKKIVEKIPQDKFRFFIAAFIFLAGLDLAILP